VSLKLRSTTAVDAGECGRICYHAFAAICRQHGFPPDFPSTEVATDLWSGLDAHPDFFSVVAEIDGKVVGCNALDERSEIFAVGPVAVDPDVQNRGIGRALMTAVLERSHLRRASGVRLMQSAYHSRSLSLYAKLGFDVRESFAVINGKQLAPAPSAYSIRAATSDDLEGCNALCQNVHGVARGGELLEAISSGMAKVVERNGSVTGYTTGIGYFAHSVAETNDDIIALITHAREFSGPGFLILGSAAKLGAAAVVSESRSANRIHDEPDDHRPLRAPSRPIPGIS
jgi:predicted N-acetyltransferase YhbS